MHEAEAMTELPTWLKNKMEQAGLEYGTVKTPHGASTNCDEVGGFREGVKACYAALLERSPEFDAQTAESFVCLIADTEADSSSEEYGLRIAKWQHEQDRALIAARDAEITAYRADAMERIARGELVNVYCAKPSFSAVVTLTPKSEGGK